MATFTFTGKVSGENFSIGNAQKMVDAHLAKRNNILESDAPRAEKKAALMAHDQKCVWSTKWATVDGVEVPTAILEIA